MAGGITSTLSDGRTALRIYHWAPPPGYKNFGDEISPMIVEAVLRRQGRADVDVVTAEPDAPKMLAVGSVIHHARNGDVVWGAGVNGKTWPRMLERNKDVRFRSVRGPVSRYTVTRLGHQCPEIFGDPGLMFPELFADEIAAVKARLDEDIRGRVLFVPNLNDDRFLEPARQQVPEGVHYTTPNLHPFEMAARISEADLVLSSSLHGLVFAEAYGVPARLVTSYFEPVLKYVDYFEGTGRSLPRVYEDAKLALDGQDHARPAFDADALLAAFPQI